MRNYFNYQDIVSMTAIKQAPALTIHETSILACQSKKFTTTKSSNFIEDL